MQKLIDISSKTALVLIMLVVLAGSVVRMTGSGMGCPDWPKCFGYIIPPTEESQVQFSPGKTYKKGQIIVWNESLQVAKDNFVAGDSFSESDWEKYTKHDYAIFNATHTWIEYINRLLGALSGFPVLFLFGLSIFQFKKDKILFLLAGFTLFFLGFEAWLGKVVVDGNLVPGQITIHMLGALIIMALLVIIINRNAGQNKTLVSKKLKGLVLLGLFLTLIQILMGTNVRESVDELVKLNIERTSIINNLSFNYYFHRSFSLIVLALNVYLFFGFKKEQIQMPYINIVLILIALEILMGVIFNYISFPKQMQPPHLIIGFLLFAAQLKIFIGVHSNERK